MFTDKKANSDTNPRFQLLDTVRLRESKYGIPGGSLGAIVEIYEDAYVVEFVDLEGNTYEQSLAGTFHDADLVKG